jgi:hypothetical protein
MATIQELESFKLSDAVDFHKELNPKLWEDNKLDPEVRDQLLLIAEDFVEYLGISNLKVRDVTISGSNAAYSYTPHSDLDLHVLVDFNELPNNEVYQELFTAKKTIYNDAHDITVRDVPVELYVQDTNNPVQSLGEYSIVHDKWIRIPKKRRANFDQAATKLKYEKLGELIELAIKSRDPKRVNDTIALVKRYRKSGLDKAGEFGPENLAYKAVRKQGLVQALHDLKAELHGEKLSIEEDADKQAATLKIQKHLNKKYGANLDLDGKLGPLTLKSINKFMPRAKTGLADEPNKTTAVQGKKLKETATAPTFAGKDPMSFKSPNGGTPTMLLVTAQGSRYLITSDGMVLRNKSAHASTGGEDQGLKDWSDVIEYYDPSEKPGGAPFALSVSKAIEKRLPIALSNTKDGKRALMIYANGGWKVAKVSDIYNNVATTDDPIIATYSTTPKLNWNVLDYDVGPNKLITRAHPGSPVTHGIKLTQSTNIQEAKIDAHRQGDTIWINYFEVPEKGKGLGTQEYMKFEKSLPKDIKKIRLVASDAGYGPTHEFWDRMGFDYAYPDDDNEMVKLLEASGYIPSAKEKNDPRFKTALTVDVKPDAIKKNAKAFGFKTSRAGIPPQARADGKIAEDLMREFKTFLGEQQEEMFPGYDEQHREKRLGNWLAKSWGVQNGKPQTFYHATTKDFDTFNTHGTGFASALGMAYEVERHGSFFAVDPKFAEGFIEDPNTGRVKEGGRVLPVHLSIQSPIDLRDDALSRMLSDEETVDEFKANDIDLRSIYNHFYELERWELFDGPEGAEFIDNLQKLGFDGAIINESIPNDSNAKSGQVWVAFSPNQVKSVYNRGSFSSDDARLTKESG